MSSGIHRAGPQLVLLPYQFPILCVDCCDAARTEVEELGKMSVKWELEGKGTKRKWWVVTASPGNIQGFRYCNRESALYGSYRCSRTSTTIIADWFNAFTELRTRGVLANSPIVSTFLWIFYRRLCIVTQSCV